MQLHDVSVVAARSEAVGLFVENGRTELRIPHGMATDIAPRDAFRLLYLTFAAFKNVQSSRSSTHHQDGVEADTLGRALASGPASFVDAYSIDSLFNRSNPLRLLSLRPQMAERQDGNLQHADRHLHHALFNDEDAPFFPKLPTRRSVCERGTADIVGLYFFLADDFYRNLLQIDPGMMWGRFAPDGMQRATDFRHRHLRQGDSLYEGDPLAQELLQRRLQQLLRTCYRQATLRSSEFLTLYAALERYLHPALAGSVQQGQIWGMRDFWPVWESMCLHEAMQQASETGGTSIVSCDSTHLPPHTMAIEHRETWNQQQQSVFANNGIRRRPDLLLQRDSQLVVVDFKYYPTAPTWHQRSPLAEEHKAKQLKEKERKDLDNIELYGLLLHRHLAVRDPVLPSISLEFWLPGGKAERIDIRSLPAWNPPLAVTTLPSLDVIRRYGERYAFAVRTGNIRRAAYAA
ncbi:hypothetical protein [Stenotrophomonas indicatrix]|uniref:hypothetical protein n=1 Tax=Stenotrophomonas indicatrix TaxID=2045451 RepID=UPI003D6D588D